MYFLGLVSVKRAILIDEQWSGPGIFVLWRILVLEHSVLKSSKLLHDIHDSFQSWSVVA